MGMSPKERVISQIMHEETDYIPYVLRFEVGTNFEEQLDIYYGNTSWRIMLDNAIRELPVTSSNMIPNIKNGDAWTDLYGARWKFDMKPYEPIEPSLRKPSLDGFELPSIDMCFDSDWDDRARQLIEVHKDYFLVAQATGLFERTWTLRGLENALVDMVIHADFYDELLEILTEHYLEILGRLLSLPIDGILFSDDWGAQQGVIMGAERWRKFFKPRLARLYQCVHDAGKYVLTHCDGSIEEILADAIEIGLNVYQSVQPEARNNNPYELKRKYGDNITFWGGLGSQSIIPFGTPDEIRREIKQLCHKMGNGGGYILGPSKEFQPETPVENAAAVVEAFLEQTGSSISNYRN